MRKEAEIKGNRHKASLSVTVFQGHNQTENSPSVFEKVPCWPGSISPSLLPRERTWEVSVYKVQRELRGSHSKSLHSAYFLFLSPTLGNLPFQPRGLPGPI